MDQFTNFNAIFERHTIDYNSTQAEDANLQNIIAAIIQCINQQMFACQQYFGNYGINGQTSTELTVFISSQQCPSVSNAQFAKYRFQILNLLKNKYGNRVSDDTHPTVNNEQIRFSISIKK